MTKIYTKTGDSGETGLFGGPRVKKDSARIEAYGTVDELNAVLGLVRCETLPGAIDEAIARIQNELFDLGAELATPNAAAHGMQAVGAAHITRLEAWIDEYESQLPALKNFILPGGSRGAGYLHLARTVCRRAERRLVTLLSQPQERVSTELVVYLNRLSDLLFVLARAANAAAGQSDTPWQRGV